MDGNVYIMYRYDCHSGSKENCDLFYIRVACSEMIFGSCPRFVASSISSRVAQASDTASLSANLTYRARSYRKDYVSPYPPTQTNATGGLIIGPDPSSRNGDYSPQCGRCPNVGGQIQSSSITCLLNDTL